MIKFFNLQKNDKKNDTQPDYRISFKVDETFMQGGACWIKKDKAGKNFLSCKLGDIWKDHTDPTKSQKGWHIAEDGKDEALEEALGHTKAPVAPKTAPQGDENDEDVGF